MRAVRLLLGLAAAAGELAAQTLHPAVGASVVAVRVRSAVPAGIDVSSGAALGEEGTLSFGRWLLDVRYLQGRLDPGSPNASARDLVEGRVRLGFHLLPWLTLGGGRSGRAYVLASGIQRWLWWELRARAEATFIGSAATGYAELWRAVSTEVNVPERFDHAQGGEAGIVLRLSRLPFEAQVAYRIDHAVLGRGTRLETVDGVVVGLRLAHH
jgi:hypothetical protein